jgi:Myb-like DNA-binding domain
MLTSIVEKDKVDWRVIASYLPGRNNKDCRKRWHYRVSASMNLGPWSQTEDELLKMGIHRYGTQ